MSGPGDKLVVIQASQDDKSSSGRTRTYDPAVNSRLLYQLSYRGMGWEGENSVAAIAMQVCFVAVSGFLSLRDALYRLRGSFCRFFVFFGAFTNAFGHVRPGQVHSGVRISQLGAPRPAGPWR